MDVTRSIPTADPRARSRLSRAYVGFPIIRSKYDVIFATLHRVTRSYNCGALPGQYTIENHVFVRSIMAEIRAIKTKQNGVQYGGLNVKSVAAPSIFVPARGEKRLGGQWSCDNPSLHSKEWVSFWLYVESFFTLSCSPFYPVVYSENRVPVGLIVTELWIF